MNPWLQLVAGNILVATLIGGLAWQVGRSGRRAKLAHLLWLAVFVKLITPPIVLLPINVPESWLPASAASVTDSFPFRRLSTGSIDRPSALDSGRVDSAPTPATSQLESAPGWFFPNFDLGTCLGIVWLFGFVLVSSRGLIRFIRFRRLLLREGNHDEEASAFVRGLLQPKQRTVIRSSRGPRLSRGPRVLRIPIRVSPMLFGFGFRPAIVCPDQLWQSLSENDRHAFLAHEAAHYHRRDHWVRWLEWIVSAAYWWFPGVYIARHQLQRHEEACCDAWAVRKLGSPPRQYAEALLRVVDFISEYGARMPRFASGMQPTDSLEERLRLVMQGREPAYPSSGLQLSAGAACCSLLLIHPIPLPTQPLSVDVNRREPDRVETLAGIEAASLPVQRPPAVREMKLPEAPQGFWNEKPLRTWASFSLKLPGARLVAESSRGISIEVPGRDSLRFAPDDLAAIVEIPATRRVVIGDRAGRLRLWDLPAGMPVSLIGRHAAGVTSLAYHESSGLVSGDGGGSVMRWDLQSGQVLATWSGAATTLGDPLPIQSVRFSADGSSLAVLLGAWNDLDAPQEVRVVESRSLTTVDSIEVPRGTAVVLQSPEFGWIAVDWSGAVRSIETRATIATIDKHDVSSLVLSSVSSRLDTDPLLN